MNRLGRMRGDTGEPVSRYGFAFVFMLNTGIRLGEMIALEWGDITDSNEGVRINKNAIMVKSRDPDSEGKRKRVMIVQNTPKSQKSNRFIPLNSAAKEAVDALRKIKNSDRVVSTRKGTPVTPSPFQKAIDNLCAKAEINRFGLHALRHTFATKMIKKGVDIKVVSELLGHSSVKITYDIYVHVLDEQRAKAVEVVDFT